MIEAVFELIEESGLGQFFDRILELRERFIIPRAEAGVLATVLSPFIPDDPAKPGAEIAGDIEAGPVLPSEEKGILREVAGSVLLPSKRAGIKKRHAMVLTGERREGLAGGGIGGSGHCERVHRGY